MQRALFQVHLWVGLAAGLLVALLGVSGSALVFRGDLERWSTSDWSTVPVRGERHSLDETVGVALRRLPGRELARLVVPPEAASSVEVVLQLPKPRNLAAADLVSVFVDPYTLEVLGARRKADTLLGQLQDFHYALFAGEPGLKVNGVAALALLLLALSGPVLWWPARGRWKQAFTVRRGPPAATWRDLHALAGVVSWGALMLITLTALYFAFRGTATAVVTLASGAATVSPPRISRPAMPPAGPDGGADPAAVATAAAAPAFASLDALVAAARRAEPDARLDELRPARTPERPASLSFRLPGDSVLGRHRLFLDPLSAEVLRIDRHESLDFGGRVFANMAPWHFGSFGGRITQWLWFVAGLVPALLLGSGGWLWLRKRRRRARAAATAAG
jgi:uncharacterized iron-regulated membrane protein